MRLSMPPILARRDAARRRSYRSGARIQVRAPQPVHDRRHSGDLRVAVWWRHGGQKRRSARRGGARPAPRRLHRTAGSRACGDCSASCTTRRSPTGNRRQSGGWPGASPICLLERPTCAMRFRRLPNYCRASRSIATPLFTRSRHSAVCCWQRPASPRSGDATRSHRTVVIHLSASSAAAGPACRCERRPVDCRASRSGQHSPESP